MLACSEAIARSALLRRESRGGHARLDHPSLDPALGRVNTVVRKDGEAMSVTQSPLPEMPAELRAIVEAELEAVKV
jgi:succinate dehydrogenase / fumarate reductase flavoprotein subunit